MHQGQERIEMFQKEAAMETKREETRSESPCQGKELVGFVRNEKLR